MGESAIWRLRVTFSTDDIVKYVGHLDQHRAWERAIRRASLPLAYTQGFNPQPRLQFAAALPVGFTGLAELVDVFLVELVEPGECLNRLQAALPTGIRPYSAELIAKALPSLQSMVCGAAYRVEVEIVESLEMFAGRLEAFLGRPAAWRERRKGKQISRYDLRPLVEGLSYAGPLVLGHAFQVAMKAEPGATGRPDELLAELELGDVSRRIIRTQLVLRGPGG